MVDENQCQSMIDRDIMTPLSAMIRDTLTQLDQIRMKKYRSSVRSPEGALPDDKAEDKVDLEEEEGAVCVSVKAKRKRLKTDVEEEQWGEALEQGLHLLWNIM